MKNRYNIKTIFSNFSVFLAFTMLSSITFSLFSPIIETNATDSLTTTMSATVNPVISLTAPDDSAFDFGEVVPTDEGKFSSKEANVLVKTNNTAGYKLYISSNSTQTSLTSPTSTSTIKVCGSNVTSTSMAKDTWGWSLNNGKQYNPIKTTNSTVKTQSGLTKTTPYSHTVTIGMKISTATQSGNYSNVIKFTAVTL